MRRSIKAGWIVTALAVAILTTSVSHAGQAVTHTTGATSPDAPRTQAGAGGTARNVPAKGCPSAKTCSAYVLESYRWPSVRGIATLRFSVNPLQPWVSAGDAEKAVLAASRAWSTAHGAIRIGYLGTTTAFPVLGDGLNTIGWSTLGSNNLATANVFLKNGKVVEADITLNALYPWGWTPCTQRDASCGASSADLGLLKRFDIQSVVTHEIGHWLGIGHIADQKASEQSMFTTVLPGERKQTTLALGDVAAVRRAYPCRGCRMPKIYAP